MLQRIESGNLEFLCTLNTPSPERTRYLLELCEELCEEKKTAHLRRALLETQDLLRNTLFFWEGASHQTDQRGWWVQELTSKCGKCKRTWQALHFQGGLFQGGLHRLQSDPTLETDLAQEKECEPQAPADIGHCDVFGSSGRNRKNIPSQ